MKHDLEIRCGNAVDLLLDLYHASVQAMVTSVPYWGIRDYGTPDVVWPSLTFRPSMISDPVTVPEMTASLGLEERLVHFVGHLVLVFRRLRRSLRGDGTVWLNIADNYANHRSVSRGRGPGRDREACFPTSVDYRASGFAVKQLVPQASMVAHALQADGWFLRQSVVWEKPNAMVDPGSGQRPGTSHEYLFMLSPGPDPYYDVDAVRVITGREASWEEYEAAKAELGDWNDTGGANRLKDGHRKRGPGLTHPLGRALRSVWSIATTARPVIEDDEDDEEHTATFPPELPRLCIQASTRPGDLVLDCFSGMGTTGAEACKLGRRYLGFELSKVFARKSLKHIARELEDDADLERRIDELQERERTRATAARAEKHTPGQEFLFDLG